MLEDYPKFHSLLIRKYTHTRAHAHRIYACMGGVGQRGIFFVCHVTVAASDQRPATSGYLADLPSFHSTHSKLTASSLRRAASIDSLVDLSSNNSLVGATKTLFATTKNNESVKVVSPGSPLLPKRTIIKTEKIQQIAQGM